MATFVLVHGSYCGGWSWKKVAPLLRAAGHDVYTPTLTGLGERAHLLTPEVNQSTHIQDITNVLFYEDLHDVILLGWSIAGMVITGVAGQMPERLRHLIYLEAAVPADGEMAFDMIPGMRESWLANSFEVNGARVNARVARQDIIDHWHITNPDDVDWVDARLTPMPLATSEEPIRLPEYHVRQLPCTYIACTGSDWAEAMAQRARDRGWDYYELPRGHFELIAAPDELVALLLNIADGGGRHA